MVHPQKSGGIAAATEKLAQWAHAGPSRRRTSSRRRRESPGTEQAHAAAAGADLVLAGRRRHRELRRGRARRQRAYRSASCPRAPATWLARNLGLPVGLRDAAAVAFTGRDRAIDLIDIGLGGRVTTCSVMAGIGLTPCSSTRPRT